MVLAKREKYLLIGVLVLVGATILYWSVSPLITSIEETSRLKVAKTKEVNDARSLLLRRDKMLPLWREMQGGGLKDDRAEAENQVLRAINEWGQAKGIKVSVLVNRQSAKGRLPEIMFDASCTGNIKAVAGLLEDMKNSKIPIRLNEMTITARKEATDDVAVSMKLSTIYTAAKTASPTSRAAATETTGARR
ncbi:MAG: hypothetical protein EHM48_06940 [Planctomycetaceae bacterium]|nr:MAG: hypothetical protein EHM48_06940 [Planctomycetaceae bacterium]